MKNNLNWFLAGMVICFIALLFLNQCDKKDKPQVSDSQGKIAENKKQLDTVKVEVTRWKEAKTKFIYRTKFDTLATIDTVLVQLANCDTIVKIDSVIIFKQTEALAECDTIIFQQDELVDELNKDLKKAKRKILFAKIISGAILVFATFLATQ